MPLVFVHGVSNRARFPDYGENELSRNAFFRTLVFPQIGLPDRAKIFNPYWGDDGVTFRWGNASLPERDGSIESFGPGEESSAPHVAVDVLGSFSDNMSDIVALAKRSLLEAVEIVWSGALSKVNSEEEATALAESYSRALSYAHANPKPDWLDKAKGANFIDLLLFNARNHELEVAPVPEEEEEQWETFGSMDLLGSLKDGLNRLTSASGSKAASVITSLARKRAHIGASLFLGDVFQYLNRRGDKHDPGPIVKKVLSDFHAARNLVCIDDPKLVIIGHSLGGLISYDILTYFDPSIQVDEFVTVGSQVALFEEMTLCGISQPTVPANPPGERLECPANVCRWLNVLDYNDIFGFRVEGVFDGAQDFSFKTELGLMDAHGGYFRRPEFYRRLGERLAAL
jgi:hypothetical protein